MKNRTEIKNQRGCRAVLRPERDKIKEVIPVKSGQMTGQQDQ